MAMTAIKNIEKDSPAYRCGLKIGDTVLSINGKTILDVLDYKFYAYDKKLLIEIKSQDGEIRTVSVTKREGEDMGLDFETYLMDKARTCANDCIFCFVDQMPKGMRDSLYFKDDDARLSFLLGNYITLTNLSEREVQRIIDLRVSPVNVSVHTTNPDLRAKMLGIRNGERGINILKRLADAGITINCQIVSCPDINDGDELLKTLNDLSAMTPAVNSIAVVPVGITKFRDKLFPLKAYDKDNANKVIDLCECYAEKMREKIGSSLVYCSDEFYLLGEREIPPEDFYEEFSQLDNGVGMLRLLKEEFTRALKLLDEEDMKNHSPFIIATGVSASPLIGELVAMAKTVCPTLQGEVVTIKNDFFGHTITVSGLVTGQDLISQLSNKTLPKRLIIPSNMLRSGEEVFLDDITVSHVEKTLNVEITAVDQDGYELCDAIFGLQITERCLDKQDETEYYQYNQ